MYTHLTILFNYPKKLFLLDGRNMIEKHETNTPQNTLQTLILTKKKPVKQVKKT